MAVIKCAKSGQGTLQFVIFLVVTIAVAVIGKNIFSPTLKETLNTAFDKADTQTVKLLDKVSRPLSTASPANSDSLDTSSYGESRVNQQPIASEPIILASKSLSGITSEPDNPGQAYYAMVKEDPTQFNTNNTPTYTNTAQANTTTASSTTGASNAIPQSGPYSAEYWASQPAAVQALQNISDPAERQARATELAHQGYTIDVPIMVWGWDPQITMELRGQYGYTWVPSALQPNVQIAPGLTMPGTLQPYDANNPPAGSIIVPQQFSTNNTPASTNTTQPVSTTTTNNTTNTSNATSGSGSYSDEYWASQPAAVQALRYMDDPSAREAKATELAHQGYTIDVPIMVWDWDAQRTMESRGQYGYTWVPSALQPNIQIAPNLTMPGVEPYDADHPPAGSIIVPSQFTTNSNN